MKVVFFQRKPNPNKNFSIEILFDQIRANLPKDISFKKEEAKYYSKGLFKRLYITIDAIFKQGDINHVTGDINFITLFLKKRKTVLTLLDLRVLNHPNKITRKLLKLFWVDIPIRRAEYITTISVATKETLLKNVTINPKKVRVMYIPVANLLEYSHKEFNKDNITILQIGTKKNKNILRLIDAIKDIKCKLEIIGELNQEQIDKLKANNINYENSFRLSNQELKQKYIESDILAFVSTHEGFGMPIIEAQIIGRPVITSNLLSMPEVAGKGAHIVDPYNINEIKNGIIKIISDDNYRKYLVENGKINSERFSAKKISMEYASLYREIHTKNQ